MVCLDFWTAGVDVQTRAQFKWENTGRAIDSTLPFNSFIGPYTCLYYYVDAATNLLGTVSCSVMPNWYTLCEAT